MSPRRADRVFVTLSEGYLLSRLGIDEMALDHVLRGGSMCSVDLEAGLLGLLDMEARQHDIAALILNEYFLGEPHCYLVAYAETRSTSE